MAFVEIVDSIEIFSFKLAFGGVHVLGVALIINVTINKADLNVISP